MRPFYFFVPAIFMMCVDLSAQEVTAIQAHSPDANSAAIRPKTFVLGPLPIAIHEIPPSLTSDHYVHQIPSGSCNRDCVHELPHLPDNSATSGRAVDLAEHRTGALNYNLRKPS